MTIISLCFDALLMGTLLWLAWQLLRSKDIFKAVVLFISFGLLMSLAWVRMHAPDVALAEATISAGLTGPLFLSALSRARRRLSPDEDRASGR